MPVDPDADLEITGFEWVPAFAVTERAEARPAFRTALSEQLTHYGAIAPQMEGV